MFYCILRIKGFSRKVIYLTLNEKSIFTLENNIINKNTVIIIHAKIAKYNIFNVEVGRN